MNPLILAATIGQLAVSPATECASGESTKVERRAFPPEPERAPTDAVCRICLLTYIDNPLFPTGLEMIREECDFTVLTVLEMRSRQVQIATEGNYSYLHWEDWGTWYGPHRIQSVIPVLQPPCY
jgi:hypothetical protein